MNENNYLNKAALSIPTLVSQPFGNLGRNVVRTDSLFNLDLGVHKTFPLPAERFSDASDSWLLLLEFMQFVNITVCGQCHGEGRIRVLDT